MSAALRRWKRVKMDVRVRLWREQTDGVVVVLRSFELGEGGMSVYTPEPMALGTMVRVSFSLPNGDLLHLHAIVRNQRGFRCGLEFVKLGDTDRAALARFVERSQGLAADSLSDEANA